MAINKKNAAEDLFNAGWTQQTIASILELSEQTISAWKIKHNWEQKRATRNMSREVAEDRVWRLINFQLLVLDANVEDQELKLKNKEINALKPLDKGDVDALQKLWTTVKAKQLDWSVLVNNVKDLTGFVAERDSELAKQLLNHCDDFLNYKRKNL